MGDDYHRLSMLDASIPSNVDEPRSKVLIDKDCNSSIPSQISTSYDGRKYTQEHAEADEFGDVSLLQKRTSSQAELTESEERKKIATIQAVMAGSLPATASSNDSITEKSTLSPILVPQNHAPINESSFFSELESDLFKGITVSKVAKVLGPDISHVLIEEITQQLDLSKIFPGGYPFQLELDQIIPQLDEDDGKHIWTLLKTEFTVEGYTHTFGLVDRIKNERFQELQDHMIDKLYPAIEPSNRGIEILSSWRQSNVINNLLDKIGFSQTGEGPSIQITIPGIGKLARVVNELVISQLFPEIEIIPTNGIAGHREYVILSSVFGIPISTGREFMHDFYVHFLRIFYSIHQKLPLGGFSFEIPIQMRSLNETFKVQRRNVLVAQLMIDFGVRDISSPDSKFRAWLTQQQFNYDADQMLALFQRRLGEVVDGFAYKTDEISRFKNLMKNFLPDFKVLNSKDYQGFVKEFGEKEMEAVKNHSADYKAGFEELWRLYQLEYPEIAGCLVQDN